RLQEAGGQCGADNLSARFFASETAHADSMRVLLRAIPPPTLIPPADRIVGSTFGAPTGCMWARTFHTASDGGGHFVADDLSGAMVRRF
ncbi:MAG: hypothetical protein ABMA01_18300, partial [Chthoniobacteraceae bacterium]